MGFKCGMIGLPNVGKSTIYNALTSEKARVANYPFCTIEPNTGVVQVVDSRLEEIESCIPTQRLVPTKMTFVDIAGLVEDALENHRFLSHIRETHAIAHVVRCFSDPDILHIHGSLDPIRDIGNIEIQLILSDLETVNKRYAHLGKLIQSSKDKKLITFSDLLEKVKLQLEDGKPIRALKLSSEELKLIADLHLITAKKMFYIANVDDQDLNCLEKNPHFKKVLEYAQSENSSVIPICGKIESEIAELKIEEKKEFLQEIGLKEPGLNRVIREGYHLLGLQTYFTASHIEIHAWTIQKGDKAPQAAGVIHSDFERGFIKAEVYHYLDLLKYKTVRALKEAGKIRLEGKDYTVQDGDVIHFRFAV